MWDVSRLWVGVGALVCGSGPGVCAGVCGSVQLYVGVHGTRETYDEFFPRNFNLPLFVIVLFLS